MSAPRPGLRAGLRAGAACVSIAPRFEDLKEGLYLGGFGSYRQRRAAGVHDEPQCRALALGDDRVTFVLAALDLVGASDHLLRTIRLDAARLSGLRESQMIVTCTHSHASPDTQGLWGGTNAAYEEHVAHRAASVMWEAFAAMTPARMSAASTTFGGMVRNRRGWPETDEALTTVRILSSIGAPVATLVNYACHPTAVGRESTEVSRDWCGYAADAVERELGGVAVYVNGAIGDVNPAASGGFEEARTLGEGVAQAAIESLDHSEDAGESITLEMRELDLPVNLEGLSERVQGAVQRAGPALSVLSKTGGLQGAALALHAAGRSGIAQAVVALAGMQERKTLRRDGRTYVQTACGYLSMGGVEAFIAPGEVLTRLALPLRASLGARHRMMLGLAQDTLGYFVPEDEWMTGRNDNYEESVSMGKHAGTALADALLALVPHARAGRGREAR